MDHRVRPGPFSEAEILNVLGTIHLAQGQPDESVTRHTQALTIATAIGSCKQTVEALIGLARSGPPALRADHAEQAVQIANRLGYRHLEASAQAVLRLRDRGR